MNNKISTIKMFLIVTCNFYKSNKCSHSLFSGKPLNEILVMEEFDSSTKHFLFVTFSAVREKNDMR